MKLINTKAILYLVATVNYFLSFFSFFCLLCRNFWEAKHVICK